MKHCPCLFLFLFLLLLCGCAKSSGEIEMTEAPGRKTTEWEKPEETGFVPEEETEKTEEKILPEEGSESVESEKTAVLSERAASFLTGMTMEEKASQVLMVRPELLTGYDLVTASSDATEEALSRLPVGGFYYLARNFEERKQSRRMLSRALGFSLKGTGLPLFFCTDPEGKEVLDAFAMEGEISDLDYLNKLGYFAEPKLLPFSSAFSSPEDAAARIREGSDMVILTEGDPAAARDTILQAVETGALSGERLDQAVGRILTEKFRWMDRTIRHLGPERDGELLYFADAFNLWYTMNPDPDLPKNVYPRELFKREGDAFVGENADYRFRRGVDVSHHSGEIDWEQVKESGIDFAILRLGYRGYGEDGVLNPDRQFQTNYEKATAAGLDVGAYVFSQAVNETEAREEAALVLSELDGRPLSLPVVFDPESIKDANARTDSVSREQFTDNTIAFCEMIREAGYDVMIYSNMIWEAEMLDLSRLEGIPVWYADYEPYPQSPYAFTFWQYSESGHVPGIDGDVDLNLWILPQ